MSDNITVTGVVATPPRTTVVAGDLTITSFRLASGQRRFDKGRNRWVDADTNWYTVTAFRQLAVNVGHSVLKGDRVVATGRLRIKEWSNDERKGTTIDVEADAVGHDLAWGTTAFTRVQLSQTAQPQEGQSTVEPGFPSSAADAWGAPLTPLGFADAEGHASGVAAGGDGGSNGTGDGDDAGDGDGWGGGDDDDREDSPALQPSFSAADTTPF